MASPSLKQRGGKWGPGIQLQARPLPFPLSPSLAAPLPEQTTLLPLAQGKAGQTCLALGSARIGAQGRAATGYAEIKE